MSAFPHKIERHTGAIAGIAACIAAVLLGFATTQLSTVTVTLVVVTLLPLASHVRWIGLRRAITEPSPVTLILFFYLCVFPQRGLTIALNEFTDVKFALTATSADLVAALVLASLGTTAFVEAFHAVQARRRTGVEAAPQGLVGEGLRVIPLAGGLAVLSLAALVIILVQNKGVAGAQEVFLGHSKIAGAEAGSFGTALWATVAVPAVWVAAIAAADAAPSKSVRFMSAAFGVVIVLAQLLVFGSRLQALVSLMGVWIVIHYLRRPLPLAAVLLAVPIVLLGSVPILSQREGEDLAGLPAHERYSRVASYGVLDASLAVRQQPASVKVKLEDPQRWADLPLYLVPSPLWPDKPRLDERRLDVFVARSVGGRAQRDTGFPTGYGTELWLYGGWAAVLLGSLVFGALAGTLNRRLVGTKVGGVSAAALLWYCFLVTTAFSYYKDGDILTSSVNVARGGGYLAAAMFVTGVFSWSPFRRFDQGPPMGQVPSTSELR